MRGTERDDPRPEVTLERRRSIAGAALLIGAGVLTLLTGELVGDGVSWETLIVGGLGAGFGVAVVVGPSISGLRGRVHRARPMAPEAVRVRPQTPRAALGYAAAVTFLIVASLVVSAWFPDALPPGILWIAMGLGWVAEARALRKHERSSGGTLAALHAPRRSFRAWMRRPVARTAYVLLRPRIDVIVDDEAPTRAPDPFEPADGPTSPPVGGWVDGAAR